MADKPRWTQGPWKGDLNVDDDQFNIYPDTGRMEFPICLMPSIMKPEVNAANAALIASAPDLYHALVEAKKALWIEVRTHWNMDDFNRFAVVEQINAALTKADGKARP